MPQPAADENALNRFAPVPLTMSMAYLDPKSHFQIANRLRDWFGDCDRKLDSEAGGVPQRPLARPSWQQQVFTDVGNFLFDNRLDPTPDNYDLAYQFRAANNANLVAAIRAEIERSGSLGGEAAELIFAESAGPVSVEALADFARRIEDQATGLTSIARQSGRDASDFRTALEKQCAQGGEPTSIIDLAQAMVSRTRQAEAELRHAHKQLNGLKSNLVEAQRAADIDPLTELPNRRAFKRDLDAAVATARAARKPLSLAFCDIDHFKQVNDRFGHDVGDRVLRYVASRLSAHFAKSGIVGRFGGEEFVIMLPGMTLSTARVTVDQARAELADRNLVSGTGSKSDGDSIGTVSFSAGVTTLTEGDSMADLLKRADDALYCAKHAGRNQVAIG